MEDKTTLLEHLLHPAFLLIMSTDLLVHGHHFSKSHIVWHLAKVFEAQRPDSVVLTLVSLHSLFESPADYVIVQLFWKIKY